MQVLDDVLQAALRAAQSAGYLSYSEADFEVFRNSFSPHRCTDGVKFGTSGPPNFTPSVQR